MSTANASSGVAPHCYTVRTCAFLQLSPTYERHLLDLEKNFEFCGPLAWLEAHWKLCYLFIGAYLLTIAAGQRYMRSRPPFQLRGALLAWNGALAAFSIFAAWRTVPAVLYQLRLGGFHETVCGGCSQQYQQAVSLYLWCFILSKVLELGDTAFIVLRKTPLIFLHWFHHATVCYFVWSTCAYPSPVLVCFMAMNYFVHAFMYSYYALRVLRIPVPKPVSMAITTMQLFQMIGGVCFTLYAYRMKRTPGVGCCIFDEVINVAMAIYLAYFVLFLNFFYRAYLSGGSGRRATIKKVD